MTPSIFVEEMANSWISNVFSAFQAEAGALENCTFNGSWLGANDSYFEATEVGAQSTFEKIRFKFM